MHTVCMRARCLKDQRIFLGSVVVDSLLIVTPIVGFWNCSMFYCALLCFHSSLSIILMGRESWLLCFVCLPGVCDCCVVLAHDVTGLSAVCDCGIFLIIITYYFV